MLTTRSSQGLAAYRREILLLSPAAWFRAGEGQAVTGSGVSQWSDQSGNARHLLQGTDSARPVSLLHEGTNYLYLPGVAGNYASTPDSVPLSITGDIDIRVRVALNDWTPASIQDLVSKWLGGADVSYIFQVAIGGNLSLAFSQNGTAAISANAGAGTGATDGAELWVRVTRASSSGDVNFYKASVNADGSPSSWTQVGTTQSTTAGAIFDSARFLEIGGLQSSSRGVAGRIYRASIYSTIGGTAPVFDADFTSVADSSTSFTESSSNAATVTINSTGSLPAQIVGRSSILFNGSAHYLKCNAFTLNQPTCVVMAVKQVSWTSSDRFFDGNSVNTGAAFQTGASPSFSLFAGATAAANANLTVGSLGVVAAIFNGASSSSRVNNTAPATGNAGSNNMGGFTLGTRGDNADFGNIQAYEVLILPVAPSSAQLDRIVAQMMAIYSVL